MKKPAHDSPAAQAPTPPVPGATLLIDAVALDRILRRIAHEIIEANPRLDAVALIGIPSRGVELSRRIAAHIAQVERCEIETGVIDVAMHRDDLGLRPRLTLVEPTRLPAVLEGRTLVLVDDVLYSGRTCRAALDALASFGRPECIQYAALIDRGHRKLPIRADFVGKNLPTAPGERVFVRLRETDGQEGVWVSKG